LEDDNFSNNNKEKQNEETHTLNAFIWIQNGKSIKLNLIGKTLSSFQGKLVLKTHDIVMPSLPINLLIPVEIPIGIQNIGSNNLKYWINKQKFYEQNNIIKEENIIDFFNEDSTLQPGEKKFITV